MVEPYQNKSPIVGLAHTRMIWGEIYPEFPDKGIAQARGIGEAWVHQYLMCKVEIYHHSGVLIM